MVLIFYIKQSLFSSYINVEKESTLKAAERELYKDDTPQNQKRSRKQKNLDFGEDEDTGEKPSGIPRQVIEQLCIALATRLHLDAKK